jgi:HSP20 family molecular chaperone IbpA
MTTETSIQSTPETATSSVASPARTVARGTPRVDVYEGPEELLLLADFPGVSPDDFELQMEGSELKLMGRRVAGDREIAYERTLQIPNAVDVEGIRAELDAGVLKLHMPKRAESKPRRIAVQTA